jgi:hypothetical protein
MSTPEKINAVANNISDQFKNTTSQALEGLTSNTYILTLFLFITCLGLVMFYFLSYSFRVAKTISYMKIYTNFQTITSMNIKALKQFTLSQFHVASSFHSAHSGFQMFDYVSPEIIIANLKSGARFLEFSVFNDKYGENGIPVVSSGYQQGEWKLMANQITFDTVCNVINDNAFSVTNSLGGVYNPKDPLFISLNLKTNYQLTTLDKIQEIITKYFINRLLPSKYSYTKRNLGKIPLIDLMGKVIILSTDGYQGSKLEEYINYSWDKNEIKRIHFKDVEKENDLSRFNKTNLTMIYPHDEGDILTTNYSPVMPWKLGCQFVAMNYQKIDEHMDKYIEKFKNTSFVLKRTY